jgi:Domain of unknown function (DUF543)
MSAEEPSKPKSDPTSMTPAQSSSSWKLPDGIEDHLEDGLIKAAVGVAVGGALGMLLFKSGKGWRSAAAASGLGVAVGSTYSRLNGSASNKIVVPPPVRVQTFQTKPLPAVIPRNDSSRSKNTPTTEGK